MVSFVGRGVAMRQAFQDRSRQQRERTRARAIAAIEVQRDDDLQGDGVAALQQAIENEEAIGEQRHAVALSAASVASVFVDSIAGAPEQHFVSGSLRASLVSAHGSLSDAARRYVRDGSATVADHATSAFTWHAGWH